MPVVPILIERKQGSGTFGTVNVTYSTLSPSESYPFLPPLGPSTRRADYDDYDFMSGVVTFLPGQTNASVNVSVKANNHSRPDSVVFLRLSYVSLVLPQQPRPGIYKRSVITGEKTLEIKNDVVWSLSLVKW